jgi:hypothetical protein
MGQNRNQDQNPSNDRDSVEQRKNDSSGDRVRGSGDSSGGITNRGRDREMSEQEQLPERGHSQSER